MNDDEVESFCAATQDVSWAFYCTTKKQDEYRKKPGMLPLFAQKGGHMLTSILASDALCAILFGSKEV